MFMHSRKFYGHAGDVLDNQVLSTMFETHLDVIGTIFPIEVFIWMVRNRIGPPKVEIPKSCLSCKCSAPRTRRNTPDEQIHFLFVV